MAKRKYINTKDVLRITTATGLSIPIMTRTESGNVKLTEDLI